jgi:ABC-type nitrate/sulfonate/bicarbonate transport system substrate-binding protein
MRRLLGQGLVALVCAFAALALPRAAGAQALDRLQIFITPGVSTDAVWMADQHGVFREMGLDVQIRVFPSGTTAFQTFRTGAGDIIFSGDLPALQYWQNGGSYRVIAPIERDSKSYVAVVQNTIRGPADLAGKTIATRVGSTGSWFISEYLHRNGIAESAVTVRNLDPPLMPVALCRGDIAGFFIWEPSPTKALQMCGDRVRVLTTAEGYIKGYNIAGARAEFLATPEGADRVTRFLRAIRRGAEIAEGDTAGVVAYMNRRFGMTEAEVRAQTAIMERVQRFDATFYEDFCSENRWQQRAGLRSGPSDLGEWVWLDGLRAVDPARVTPAPPPC